MKIYHNPRCRKSREALSILEEAGADFEIVEYLKETPSIEELTKVINTLNISPQDLIRTGETVFKEQFKGKQFSDQEWIEILHSNPILIERPIVVSSDGAVIGRPPEKVRTLLSD